MAQRRRKPTQSRPRKKPAYPKPGTGEDYPARRPGTKVGETRSGGKIMQSTRATQARRARKAPTRAVPIPRARRGDVHIPNWEGGKGKPTRDDPWRI